MTMQVRKRTGEDSRWYAPSRDVAAIFPDAIRKAFHELRGELESDPYLAGVEHILGVTDEDLCRAATVYSKIVSAVVSGGKLADAFENSGFQYEPAQALVGMVFMKLMTQFFIRHYGETLLGKTTDENLPILQQCVDELAKFNKDKDL